MNTCANARLVHGKKRIIEAERFGEPQPPQLTMNDLLNDDVDGDTGCVGGATVQID